MTVNFIVNRSQSGKDSEAMNTLTSRSEIVYFYIVSRLSFSFCYFMCYLGYLLYLGIVFLLCNQFPFISFMCSASGVVSQSYT